MNRTRRAVDELPLYAGESCEFIDDVPSVEGLMNTLIAETRTAMR